MISNHWILTVVVVGGVEVEWVSLMRQHDEYRIRVLDRTHSHDRHRIGNPTIACSPFRSA